MKYEFRIVRNFLFASALLCSCSVYDNYDIDLMDADASTDLSSSVKDDVSSSSEKSKGKEESSSSAKDDEKMSSAKSGKDTTYVVIVNPSSSSKAESSESSGKVSSSSGKKADEKSSSSKKDEPAESSSSIAESSSSVVKSSSSVSGFACGEDKMIRGKDTLNTIQVYNTCWTTENLTYVSGEYETHGCYGDNDENCKTYGRLYSYEAAEHACDKNGWRLPTLGDMEKLLEYTGVDAFVAGTELKTADFWVIDEDDEVEMGKDSFGFSALPGGLYDGKKYSNQGMIGYWWTSEKKDQSKHYVLKLSSYDDAFYTTNALDNTSYVSVRCVLDLN